MEQQKGYSLVKIDPYYSFSGTEQKGYRSLQELVHNALKRKPALGHQSKTINKALSLLASLPVYNWVHVAGKKQVLIKNQ